MKGGERCPGELGITGKCWVTGWCVLVAVVTWHLFRGICWWRGTDFGGNVGWQCLVAIEGDRLHWACYITLWQCLLTVSIGTTESIELSRQPNHRVNGNYVTFCLLLYNPQCAPASHCLTKPQLFCPTFSLTLFLYPTPLLPAPPLHFNLPCRISYHSFLSRSTSINVSFFAYQQPPWTPKRT